MSSIFKNSANLFLKYIFQTFVVSKNSFSVNLLTSELPNINEQFSIKTSVSPGIAGGMGGCKNDCGGRGGSSENGS